MNAIQYLIKIILKLLNYEKRKIAVHSTGTPLNWTEKKGKGQYKNQILITVQ